MIGQLQLIKNLKNYDITTFPHSLLLVGDVGSGKHTFTNEYICPKLDLPCIDITDRINFDTISEISVSPINSLYSIDCDKITVREQNVILKFLEEPSSKVFIILYTTNKNLLLDTVINRCQVWNMSKYKEEELLNFTQNKNILNIAKTPGQILKFTECDIFAIKDLCNKIFTFGGKASTANILTLSDKINWKDENDKFDLNVFNQLLIDEITELVRQDNRYINAYNLTVDNLNKQAVLHVDKRRVFEDFLVNLRYQLRKDFDGNC